MYISENSFLTQFVNKHFVDNISEQNFWQRFQQELWPEKLNTRCQQKSARWDEFHVSTVSNLNPSPFELSWVRIEFWQQNPGRVALKILM